MIIFLRRSLPARNNQFRIKHQVQKPDSRKLGWGYQSTKGFQFLGDAKKIDDPFDPHYELKTYIDWQTLAESNLLTLIICDDGKPITTISPTNFQRQDYTKESFISQLSKQLSLPM